jgi:GDP-fucose transporter C1
MGANENVVQQSIKIATVVTAYWVVSISMVFLNKYLLSSEDVKLEAPIFITWYQCVVAVAVCYMLGWLSQNFPSHFGGLFPPFHLNMQIAQQILPLSCAFVGMIAFNNLCLKYVGVSFYNVGRSLTTVFNVVLSYMFLGQSTSLKALLACGVIVFGFFLGIDQEDSSGSLSKMGVFFGISVSICVALNSIFVKKVLPLVDFNEWRLTLYNNFNAMLLFVPVMVVLGEGGAIAEFPKLFNLQFWFVMTMGGIFGVAISLVTTLQIKFTSPLTHNVSGTAKACAQTVLAVSVYSESKTGLWWLSNFMVLGGSLIYTQVKRMEMQAAEEAKQRQQRV